MYADNFLQISKGILVSIPALLAVCINLSVMPPTAETTMITGSSIPLMIFLIEKCLKWNLRMFLKF